MCWKTINSQTLTVIKKNSSSKLLFKKFTLFRCGSFSEAIQEVHLFLSARGGKTKLHQDPFSNIHCIFNGTKDWLLVHPDQTDLVYMSDDSKYEWGGYSEIDIDSVDLDEFPKIKDVHYSKVRMNKGDCIFMPGGKRWCSPNFICKS